MDSLEKEDLKSTAELLGKLFMLTCLIQAWLDLVYGGMDTREWALSMRVIRQALEAVPDNIKYRPTSLF
jgi:hypothetical protein